MPAHYVTRSDLDASIADLEKAGEEVVSVVSEGNNFWIFTRQSSRRAGKWETR